MCPRQLGYIDGQSDRWEASDMDYPQSQVIYVICAWCNQAQGAKNGLGQAGESHTCCPGCIAEAFGPDAEVQSSKGLDNLGQQVLV